MTIDRRLARLEGGAERPPRGPIAAWDHHGQPLNDEARRRGEPRGGPVITLHFDRAKPEGGDHDGAA